MTSMALMLSAYSVVSALLISLSLPFYNRLPDHAGSRWYATAFILSLGYLQFCHFLHFNQVGGYFGSWHYVMALFIIAPAFFLFSRPLLRMRGNRTGSVLHALPVLGAPLLPADVAIPSAFGLGALYLLWLAHSLYSLRADREHYRLEISIMGIAFTIAVVIVAIGVGTPVLGVGPFIVSYSCAVGGIFVLLNLAYILTPGIVHDIEQAALDSYAHSTLASVDCDDAVERLTRLMERDRVYTDPDLDLGTLAERLGLHSHQLSELINSRIGKGYSRYIREQRVHAAMEQLINKPSASVLTVGLDVGFSTQSNFYEAFREITGTTPGRFRRFQLSKATE